MTPITSAKASSFCVISERAQAALMVFWFWWLQEWLAMWWPPSYMRCTFCARPDCLSVMNPVLFPLRKKVALTFLRLRTSSISPVKDPGPSSNVRAIMSGSVHVSMVAP